MASPINLSRAELDNLRADLKMLEGLETEFVRAESIGTDVSQHRQRNRELITKIQATLAEYSE